jgi:hypothetical protein
MVKRSIRAHLLVIEVLRTKKIKSINSYRLAFTLLYDAQLFISHIFLSFPTFSGGSGEATYPGGYGDVAVAENGCVDEF